MAIRPTTASSFSPYCENDSRTTWAMNQRSTLAGSASSAPTGSDAETPPGADHARGDRGDDQDRLEALTENDHRGVGDHGRLAGALAWSLRLVERLVQDQAGLSKVGDAAVAEISSARPSTPRAPYHIQTLHLGDQRGVEHLERDLGPNSKNA